MTRQELEALLALEDKKLLVERGLGYYSVLVYNDHFDFDYEVGTTEQNAINNLVRAKYKIHNADN